MEKRRDWTSKSTEEILKTLEDYLSIQVKSGAIRKVSDLKDIDSGLWAALKNHTDFSPADCFSKVGYGYLVKSDKRHDECYIQEILDGRSMQLLEMCKIKRLLIRYKCRIEGCGYESDWVFLSNIKRGTGCPRCSGKEPITNQTHDERLIMYFGGNIARTENVKNARYKIGHICYICQHEWIVAPDSIAPSPKGKRKPNGCPKCGGKVRITNSEHDVRLNFHHEGKIIRKSDIIDCRTAIDHMCLVCYHTFLVEPYNIAPRQESATNLRGCPYCSGRAALTNEIHDERLVFWHGNTIARVESVRLASDPILHECNTCKNEWYVTPNKIAPPTSYDRNPTKCPLCSDMRAAMGIELQRVLKEILQEINPDIIVGVTKEIKEASIAHGYQKGIEPDFSYGTTFIESKLSIGAVFSGETTSQERYSPYGEIIHVVFEPWRNMRARWEERNAYKIMHVSMLLSRIADDKLRESIMARIKKVLLKDKKNMENGLIESFNESCLQEYCDIELEAIERIMKH